MDSLRNEPLDVMFGAESITMAYNTVVEHSSDLMLSDCLSVKLLTIILFVIYLYLLYYFKGYVYTCLSLLVKPRVMGKLLTESGYLFTLYAKLLFVVGLITFSLLSLKIYDITSPVVVATKIPNSLINLSPFAVVVLFALVYLYRVVTIRAVGKLTLNEGVAVGLIKHSNVNLIFTTLTLTPLYLILYQSFGIWQMIILYLVAFALLISLFMLILNSYMLFIQQKVSILYWFLYLCAVEFLPLSFIILLIRKNLTL